MTYREILRRVCRVTGDDEPTCDITELETDRHLQIGEFLNQIKDEVEAAHNWRSLRSTQDATVTAGTSSVEFTEVSPTARIVRIHDAHYGRLIPLVFDVTDESRPIPLTEIDLSLLVYKNTMHVDQNNAEPVNFAASPSESGITIHLYPAPAVERVLRVTFTNPQPYLDADDVDTEILIPPRALLIGTVWYTLQERGEELGSSSMYTEERYRTALNDEISNDAAEQGEYELVPV